jgi:hypothetical protein
MALVKTGSDAKAAFAVAMGLVAVASFVSASALSWLVAPFVIILILFAISRAALSDTMLVLMFFALVLENPAENMAAGQWASPFKTFGGLVLTHFKTTIGGPWAFGGMDMMLIAAIFVAVSRSKRKTAIEKVLATPEPMVKLAYLSLATVVYVFLVGKLRGGADNSMAVWQADRVTYLPIVFLLFSAGLVGPNDHVRVGKVLILSGTLRALQALYVKAIVPVTPDPITGEATLVYATSHNDSITFALTTVCLVALLIERVGGKAKRICLLCIPILLGGMWANNRRMVWVQIILVLAVVYLMTDRNAFKRKLERALLILAPLVAVYVAAGWGSKAPIFKPVQVIYSAMDTKTDTSTLWREIENFDLIASFKNSPIFGMGYGQPFWEVIPLPAVDYTLERYIPHNSVLGLWCFYGLIGVIGITSLWVAGVYLGIRSYHFSKERIDRAAALGSFAAVVVYLVQMFGDMGLGCWQGVFTVAPALAVACKLATRSGAWVNAVAKRKPAPVAAAAGAAAAGARPSAAPHANG